MNGEGVEQLFRGANAAAALLRCSRLVGLETEGHEEAMLDLASMHAGRLPVYRVTTSELTRPALPKPVQAVLEYHLEW